MLSPLPTLTWLLEAGDAHQFILDEYLAFFLLYTRRCFQSLDKARTETKYEV